MMSFATITPTRDRPNMLSFCKRQLERQTIQPKKSFFIDYPGHGNGKDLISRVQAGIEEVKAAGIDFVFIVEDDDYYSPSYFEYLRPDEQTNFIGIYETIYYNIKTARYQHYLHYKRASLFCTGFRISSLKKFRWPTNPNSIFLDIDLWQYANRVVKNGIVLKPLNDHFHNKPAAIGIKGHGEGMHGGKGHTMSLNITDPDLWWLKENTRADAYEFYKSINDKHTVTS